MRSFRQKLISFMYGRYGTDQLNNGLMVTYVLILIINMFLPSIYWSIPLSALIVYSLFRMFSRNIPARRRENEAFLKFWRPLKTELVLIKDRCKDIRTARYRKCSHCKAILKLPRKRGKHTVVCPRCKERFSVRILF